MLDIRFIREHAAQVQEAAAQKGYDVSIATLLQLDDTRRAAQQQVDALRQQRNDIAAQMKGGRPEPVLIEQGKEIKATLATEEAELKRVDDEYQALLASVPNITMPDVPLGGEADSVEVKRWGEQTAGAVDHLEFALRRDWVDFERGAKVAGAKFYYLKGDLALLENAVTQFALQFLVEKGFTYMTVPNLVNSRTAAGAGFAPKGASSDDQYFVEGEDLTLIGTAEMPLTGYHADEIIDEAKLPLLYAGYSPCYRKEAGTYGKHARGLFRVHQFNKLEMYAFCTPEQSAEVHEKILALEEELWQAIGIPYHVVNIAAGDLGAPAAKKYDIEYWSPVDETYRELTSCSNCTDFQARNLNIRVRRENGEVEVLHTLNGTAVSLARALVVILEHFQNPDGTLTVPEVLQPFMNGRKVL
ncbi:MAG: serine--tRNA ligase [Candidatus Saccharibacteria bacterium]|nr:serine--tRNA ligase [Candidatus Saccharibacteria bacterium]